MSGRWPDQYDPRYDRGEATSLRIALDNERAARARRTAIRERKLFDSVTRDLPQPSDTPEPQRASAIQVPPARFTDDELDVF